MLFVKFNPLKCCNFPFPYMTRSEGQICTERLNACEEANEKLDSPIPCCDGSCADELYSVYVNGSLNTANISAFFKHGLTIANESLEDWMPVVNKSIETCSKLGWKELKWNLPRSNPKYL